MKFRTEGSAGSLAVVIMLLGVAAVMEFIKRITDSREPYDERQANARGVAAQWGFFSMVFFSMGMWMMMDLFETDITHELVLRMSVYLGTTVFVTIAIWKDAYVAVTDSCGMVLMSLGLWAVNRWINFFDQLDTFSLSLSDTDSWTRLLAVVMFTWLTLLLGAKCLIRRKEENELD